MNLETVKKVYFIGIGGIMMSAAARYFLLNGKKVYGSDRASSRITDELKKEGAVIYPCHQAKNIGLGFDLVIYTAAVAGDNEELRRARSLKITSLTIYQLLGMLAKKKFVIAVSGMHGKSTTTALTGLIMSLAGLDPTVFVGSLVREWGSNFRFGRSSYFLSEACEYRDNFLSYHPDLLIVNNIEAEHLDYFKNITAIRKSFRRLIGQIKKNGSLIYNRGDEEVCRLVAGLPDSNRLSLISFGLQPRADLQAHALKNDHNGNYSFALKINSRNLAAKKNFAPYRGANFTLRVPGVFNVENALAVVCAGALFGVAPDFLRTVFRQFTGIGRRFEFKGRRNGIDFYDDYAHHPTEIRATIGAMKQKFNGRRVWLVFQPHLFSRTYDFLADFASALSAVDHLILAEIYPAREENHWNISSRNIVDLINKKRGKKNPALFFAGLEEIFNFLKTCLKNGDVVMTMGAGEAWRLGESLLSKKKIGY